MNPMRWQKQEYTASIPMRIIGPVKIISQELNEVVPIPFATFETPLWPSVHRGTRVCMRSGGIRATVVDERMSRSVLVEADSAITLQKIAVQIKQNMHEYSQLLHQVSRFAQLIDINTQLVGTLLYIRFEFLTGDAAGHNMATLASDRLLNEILRVYPVLRYVSISGNYCADKKAGAVNSILGRGKNVIAEVVIPSDICQNLLNATPSQIVALHVKKNLMGNIIAGGLRTANAHFANILLGFYLATGQDAANIVEGSQGLVHTELRHDDLYFSVTLPNVIVGAVGNGKDLSFVKENLELLGCLEKRPTGENARRLAIIAAAAVLCGELSLLAAQTNQGELMRSHIKLERKAV